MYNSINIKNFRAIRDLTFSDFKRLNMIVGRNNCGKTSILETLFLLTNPGNAPLTVLVNNLRHYVIQNENGWTMLFNNLDVNKPIELSAQLTHPRELRSMKIRPHRRSGALTAMKPTPGDQVPINEQMKGNFSGSESAVTGLDVDFSISEPGPGKTPQKYTSSVQFSGPAVPGPLGLQPPQLANQVSPNYKETLRATLLTSSSITGSMAARFNDIQIKKRVATVISTLKRIEPNLTALTLGSDGIIYADVGLTTLIPVNMMGDGIVKVLAIILAIADCQDGVLLIDEVETGLHISSHPVLWDAVFQSAEENRTQIVMTTHSRECIETFSEAWNRLLPQSDEARLFRLERKDADMKIVPYDRKALSTALESDWEVR